MRGFTVASAATLAVFIASLIAVGSPESARSNPGAASVSDTINPVIGDESFLATYGRLPTADDANLLRVRTHLAYVEHRLRAVDDSALPAPLRAARRRNLDLLRRYWGAEMFPAGENPTGRQPTFIDDDGRRCAVASLVEATAGTAAVERINGRFRNALIAEMDDPALDVWIESSGFTRAEVMMIQPSYDFRNSAREIERWHLITDTGLLYLNRLAGRDIPDAQRVAGVEAKAQVIDLRYQWLAGVETAAGDTLFGGAFYRAGARLGAIPISGWKYHGPRPNMILTLGGRVDGIQGVVPAAFTVPGGLLFAFDTMETRYAYDNLHELVASPIVQLRAEADWVAWARPGRPREIGWTGGFDLLWRVNPWTRWTSANFGARDLIASVTVTRFAGTIYGGVAVGLGAWSLRTQRMVPDPGPVSVSPPLGPYW